MTTTANNTNAYVLLSNETQQVPIDAEYLKQLVTQTKPTTPITRGCRVEFDKEGATLTGAVFNITSDIGNGRKMATVELEHELPGVVEIVPLDKLKLAPLSHTVHFIQGTTPFPNYESEDRRFFTIPFDNSRESTNVKDCAKILTLVAHLCCFNSKKMETFLCWLAYPLQNKGKRNQTVIVFKQENGAGVSLFFDHVMRPIHEGQLAAIREYNLFQSTFNGWAKSARIVLCEDITIGKYSMPLIKTLISSPTITVNEKMLAPVTIPNEINFVFTTQKTPHELITNPSRRFIYLTPKVADDDSFYTHVYNEIKLDGLAAFRKYLMSIDLSEYKRSFGCL
jgi:putative DNA primase/helicase